MLGTLAYVTLMFMIHLVLPTSDASLDEEEVMAHADKRILLVDDEATIRLTLEMVLKRYGYRVATAANGEEAMVWLLQKPFDLVLLDMKLPGASGMEVIRQATEWQPDTPIMILTGTVDLEDEEAQLPHGVACMHKTASPQDVLAGVRAALRQQQAVGR